MYTQVESKPHHKAPSSKEWPCISDNSWSPSLLRMPRHLSGVSFPSDEGVKVTFVNATSPFLVVSHCKVTCEGQRLLSAWGYLYPSRSLLHEICCWVATVRGSSTPISTTPYGSIPPGEAAAPNQGIPCCKRYLRQLNGELDTHRPSSQETFEHTGCC